jgi:hypothetical protein
VDSGALSGTVGQDFGGFQARAGGSFNPPDSVVGLAELALLTEIQHGKQHQASRGYGQQGRLQTVEEICLHEGVTKQSKMIKMHVWGHDEYAAPPIPD